MKNILIFSCVISIVIILFISPFIIKVKVDCKSQYGACPRQILDKLSVFNGKSLFVAKKGIKKYLKSEFLISDFSLQFKVPNILHTELLIKKAVAAFKDTKSGTMVLVDNEGRVLSGTIESVLPVISVQENLPDIGQNISSTNLFALKLASGIYQMYQIRESEVQDSSLLVELPGRFKVIFPLDGESEVLLGSLRLIYSKVKEDGNLAGYSQIDLRFKNPVLR